MSCNGNVYNIGMGCCEPVLGPVENYYTKPTIDRKLEEITSAITSGCCITPEEVDEKIEEAISGITVSGVTEEQLNEAIASAKTEIEAEIPSLNGYATEQWVEDKHYITGVDLSNYALKSEIPTVPTSNTAFTNDAGYLTEHQSLSGYATTAFVSAFTYDKATIDEKVAGGGSFDPSQYYNKTATDALLDEKLDVTAYTPTDLSNYYTKTEVDNEIISAITDVEAEIPVVPTSNTAFTNDAGYLTEHQSLSGYATEEWVEDKHYITGVDLSNYATKAEIPVVPTSNTAFTNDAGYITGVDLSNYATIGDVNNVSTALTAHTSNTTIHVTPEQVSNWNAKSDFSGSYNDLTDKPTIPTVPTDISAFNNDVGYITGVDLSNYATKDNLTAATDDMATKTWVNNQGYLTEHQSLTAYSTTQEVNTMINQSVSGKQDTLSAGTNITIVDNVISATGGGGATYTAGTGIDISGDIISTTLPITTGSGQYSVVITTSDNQYKPTASGSYSYAEGKSTSATGNTAHAEGNTTKAYGAYSHAEGYNSTASNDAAHAEGEYTSATGNSSHAEGYNTKAYGVYAHAEGNNAIASGQSSHAEGNQTKANGKFSHAEGTYTTAIGDDSHAEGSNTTAATQHSHAEGAYTKANQMYAHAEGRFTVANGYYSHAEGNNTVTYNDSEHASGEYNVSNTGSTDADKTLFSVGNGTQSSRHNAFEVRKNGDVYVTSGGTDVKLQDYLGGTTYTAGVGIDITNNVISSVIKFWCGTMSEYEQISQPDNNTIYLIHS